MELPHLGNNCALGDCNQLDFLPVKCDACSQVYCIRHYRYENHQCSQARNKDNQVPACPLCSQPVVGKRDQLPDIAVSEHIDKYCKRNELLKNGPAKAKTNLQACSFARCKQKDVIYLECNECRSKFCVKHRHPSDHSCAGPASSKHLVDTWQSFKGSCSTSANSGYELLKNKAQQISKSGQAALNRLSHPSRTTTTGPRSGAGSVGRTGHGNAQVNSLQGNLSEQEALAIALNESRAQQNNTRGAFQGDEDLALARALHESQLEQARRTNGNNKDSCVLS